MATSGEIPTIHGENAAELLRDNTRRLTDTVETIFRGQRYTAWHRTKEFTSPISMQKATTPFNSYRLRAIEKNSRMPLPTQSGTSILAPIKLYIWEIETARDSRILRRQDTKCPKQITIVGVYQSAEAHSENPKYDFVISNDGELQVAIGAFSVFSKNPFVDAENWLTYNQQNQDVDAGIVTTNMALDLLDAAYPRNR